jgi:hypothetical protein
MMNFVADRIADLIKQVVAWLVAGDYVSIERRSRGVRLSANLMREAIAQYGRTLSMPPEDSFRNLDVISVQSADVPTWSIRFDLWTVEQGRSDLSLECTVSDHSGEDLDLEIDNLHVL